MASLIPVQAPEAILPVYKNTAIERFLLYHNLGEPLPPTTFHAQLLIGMCMDHRKELVIPNEFAYVMRAAGANFRGREFEISYAVAIGGVSTIALLAHTDCGMSHVIEKREAFIRGLVERAGCSASEAAGEFDEYVNSYQIGDSVAFVLEEVSRLRRRYPKLLIVPLLYEVETDKLVQIAE